MPVSANAKLIVWTKAAGRCSFPYFPLELLLDDNQHSVVPDGEVMYIVADVLATLCNGVKVSSFLPHRERK